MSEVPVEIEFLSVEVVLALHQRQLERFGGGEACVIAASAVAQPQRALCGVMRNASSTAIRRWTT